MPLNKIYPTASNGAQRKETQKKLSRPQQQKQQQQQRNIIHSSKKIVLQVKDMNAQGEIFSPLSDYGTDG